MKNRPPILYKFLDPNALSIFKDRSLFFSKASDLNDPFEFRAQVSKTMSDSIMVKKRQEITEMLYQNGVKTGKFTGSFSDFCRIHSPQIESNVRAMMVSSQQEFQSVIPHVVNDECLILSLTDCWREVTMWSHYASNHTGFVVGFDTSDVFFEEDHGKTQLFEVNYEKELPTIGIPETSGIRDFSHPVLRTKSESWTNENEWRLIKYGQLREDERFVKGRFFGEYSFQERIVKEVIFGIEAKGDLIKQVLEDTRSNQKYEIDFYRMKRVPNVYLPSREKI